MMGRCSETDYLFFMGLLSSFILCFKGSSMMLCVVVVLFLLSHFMLISSCYIYSSCWVTQSCLTLCNPMDCSMQASLSLTISWSLLKLMSIELLMPFNHLILCCPLLFLTSVFPSIRVFTNGLAPHIRWPKYWKFSFSICPSNKHSKLIYFRIDWFDVLAVQGTLKSFSQHHSLKAPILWHSLWFTILYGSTFTSVHEYWKNHSFDYTDLCRLVFNLQKKSGLWNVNCFILIWLFLYPYRTRCSLPW